MMTRWASLIWLLLIMKSAASAGGFGGTGYGALENIKSGFYLIRDSGRDTSYLVIGSTGAALMSGGAAAPGLTPSLPVRRAVRAPAGGSSR